MAGAPARAPAPAPNPGILASSQSDWLEAHRLARRHAALDGAFARLSETADALQGGLPRTASSLLRLWRNRLAREGGGIVWKRNRNAYLRLLVDQLRRGDGRARGGASVLSAPFNAKPPEGPLPTLPRELTYPFARTRAPQGWDGVDEGARGAVKAGPGPGLDDGDVAGHGPPAGGSEDEDARARAGEGETAARHGASSSDTRRQGGASFGKGSFALDEPGRAAGTDGGRRILVDAALSAGAPGVSRCLSVATPPSPRERSATEALDEYLDKHIGGATAARPPDLPRPLPGARLRPDPSESASLSWRRLEAAAGQPTLLELAAALRGTQEKLAELEWRLVASRRAARAERERADRAELIRAAEDAPSETGGSGRAAGGAGIHAGSAEEGGAGLVTGGYPAHAGERESDGRAASGGGAVWAPARRPPAAGSAGVALPRAPPVPLRERSALLARPSPVSPASPGQALARDLGSFALRTRAVQENLRQARGREVIRLPPWAGEPLLGGPTASEPPPGGPAAGGRRRTDGPDPPTPRWAGAVLGSPGRAARAPAAGPAPSAALATRLALTPAGQPEDRALGFSTPPPGLAAPSLRRDLPPPSSDNSGPTRARWDPPALAPHLAANEPPSATREQLLVSIDARLLAKSEAKHRKSAALEARGALRDGTLRALWGSGSDSRPSATLSAGGWRDRHLPTLTALRP